MLTKSSRKRTKVNWGQLKKTGDQNSICLRPSRNDCPLFTRKDLARTMSTTRCFEIFCPKLLLFFRCLCLSRRQGQRASFQGGRAVAPPSISSHRCTARPILLVKSGTRWTRPRRAEALFGGKRNVGKKLGGTMRRLRASATTWEGDGARVEASREVPVERSSERS